MWELVPSGTMPVMSARSPTTAAAMLVMGATVVTTDGRLGSGPGRGTHVVVPARGAQEGDGGSQRGHATGGGGGHGRLTPFLQTVRR